MRPAFGDRLAAEAAQFFIRVTQPTGGGGVSGIAGGAEVRDAFAFGGRPTFQDRQRFIRGERVRDIPKVDTPNQFRGRHVREELPDRFALRLSPKIPDGIDDGGRGQVDRAFLRTDPAQLAVAGDMPPERAHVFREGAQRPPDHQWAKRGHGGDDDLIAAPDREREAVPLMRAIGFEDDVGGRVIGVGIHRVRAVELAGRWETDVADGQGGDLHGSGVHKRGFP